MTVSAYSEDAAVAARQERVLYSDFSAELAVQYGAGVIDEEAMKNKR